MTTSDTHAVATPRSRQTIESPRHLSDERPCRRFDREMIEISQKLDRADECAVIALAVPVRFSPRPFRSMTEHPSQTKRVPPGLWMTVLSPSDDHAN